MSLIIKQHFHDYGTVIKSHNRIVDKYSKMIEFLKQTQSIIYNKKEYPWTNMLFTYRSSRDSIPGSPSEFGLPARNFE